MGLLKTQIENLFHTKPKISIIVPFYNSESYILRCLESIVYGTKTDYEIICVDDGSIDHSATIVNDYKAIHQQIKLVSYGENKGLYYARLAGIKKARGKYIGFVDSDDYVSEGYFDILYEAAVHMDSDISVGQIINVAPNNIRYIQTRCSTFPYNNQKDLDGLYSQYWKQQGKCYHWHVIWNKLYKKSLFTRNMKILKLQTKHLVMLEDFIFSSIILRDVKKYCVDTKAKYFYVEHAEAATKSEASSKVCKNILDMKHAFDFVDSFLNSNQQLKSYLLDFFEWKSRYGRYWKRNIQNMHIEQKEQEILLENLQETMGQNIGDITIEDEFYYEKADIID